MNHLGSLKSLLNSENPLTQQHPLHPPELPPHPCLQLTTVEGGMPDEDPEGSKRVFLRK